MRSAGFLVLLSSLTHNVWAAECPDVFTEAASSHSAAGSISFASDARIEDSSGTLDIPNITDSTSGGSCDSQACVSSGNSASAFNLPTFETSSSATDVTVTSGNSPFSLTEGEYKDVTVEERNSLTFSSANGTYIIDTLIIEDDATVELASGDYWIDTFVLGAEAVLTVSGSDTVRIYVQRVSIGEEADLNKGESADLIVLTSYGDIILGSNSETTGVLYAQNTVTLSKDATLTGTVSANDITMAGNTRIFYQDVADDADFDSLCGGITLDHYRIEHDTQGFTCEEESITIKACSDEDCDTPYDQSTSISLSPSGWEGGDTLSFVSSVEAFLSYTTAETVELGIDTAIPSAPVKCFQNSSDSEISCDIAFVDAGFEFIGETESIKNLSDQIAEVDFSNVNLRAVKTDDDSGACVDLLDDGPRDIDLSFDCTDPATCKTNLLHDSTALTELESETISLTFTGGIASLSDFNYADAGRLTLYAQAVIEGATITSGNAQVDVVPAYLTLTTEPAELTYIDSDDTDTFTAGVDFELKLTAFGNEGTALANYVPGDLQIDMSRVAPTATGSVDGSFTYTYDETNTDGESAYTSNYDEVGRITLTVADNDYLPDSYNAASQISDESSLSLGNFIPAFFEVDSNSPSLVDTCSTFSYIGEYVPLSETQTYAITAKNAEGETTLNYGGDGASGDEDWWQLTLTNDHVLHTDNSANDGEFWGQMTVSNTDNYDGSATYTITNPSGTEFDSYTTPLVLIPKSTTLLSEFAADFDITLSNQTLDGVDIIADGNGVCFKASYAGECLALTANNITGATLRYGRLVLESTYGPETENLNVPIKTQYYDSEQWLLNTADNCTSIDFTATDGHIVLEDIEDSIDGSVGSVESTGVLVGGLAVGDQLQLDAPGAQGVLTLSLDPEASGVEWPTYLNYDWNDNGMICNDAVDCPDDGNITDSDSDPDIDFPSATITFGQFRGNDRVIQWREVFN